MTDGVLEEEEPEPLNCLLSSERKQMDQTGLPALSQLCVVVETCPTITRVKYLWDTGNVMDFNKVPG